MMWEEKRMQSKIKVENSQPCHMRQMERKSAKVEREKERGVYDRVSLSLGLLFPPF